MNLWTKFLKDGENCVPEKIEDSVKDTLVYLKNKIKNSDIFELNVVSKAEILNAGTEREEERKDVLKDISNKRTSKENLEKIKNILEWEYKYKDSTEMPSELSVSKIKELSKDKAEEKYGVTLKKPNFLVEKTELTAAEKGTIVFFVCS